MIVISSLLCTCNNKRNTCRLQTLLPSLLINKGNQLTYISIPYVCCTSTDIIWKSLIHCKAARTIRFEKYFFRKSLTVAYEDVEAICHLPNLQKFEFWVSRNGEYDRLLREVMNRAVKENSDFRFNYSYNNEYEPTYSLNRINF